MKRVHAFLITLALASCATTGTGPIATKIDHAIDCNAKQVMSQLPAIIATVATDLLSGNYWGLLLDLAKREGDDVVSCAVAASAGSAKASMAATSAEQPNQKAIAEHAEDYLSKRGAVFVAPPPQL